MQLISIPVCALSADGSVFRFANPAFTRLFGWSAEELAQKSFLELVDQPERTELAVKLQTLTKPGDSVRVQARMQRKAGERVSITWVCDRDSTDVYLTGWPEEHPVAVAADQYEKFFKLSIDMFCLGNSQGYFLKVNPAWTEVLGWSEEELLSRPFLDLVHPDDLESTLDTMRTLDDGRKILRFENRYRTKDGSYRWIMWTTRPDPATGLYYGAARDITHMKEYEASLRAAEARTRDTERLYRQILNAAQDLILVKGESSRIRWANDAFCRYYGMSYEELQGIIEGPHVEPDYTAQYVQDDLKVWTTGEVLHISEEPIIRHDGELRLFETVKSPIFDSDGHVLMTVGISRDLTERRKAAEELRAAKETAEHANRAKSTFLANMSHELRTPLNAILGYAQLMAQDDNLPIRYRDGANTILRSGEHLLVLISDVLDIAKIEAGKLELHPSELHLGNFLEMIGSLFTMRAQQKRLSFHATIPINLPEAIRADETRLRQVLINLLSNAIKFTDHGGISLRVSFQDGKLRFEVEDTGIGIPSDKIQAIFQPFEQVRDPLRMNEGTGLGLAISSQLVNMMGGTIQAESTLDQGSRFWFEIVPEIISEWRPPVHDERTILGYEGPMRRILICDDKPENRRILRMYLEPIGFEVMEAGDGEEGLAMAESKRPDLIFMDLVMPRMDGFEATRRIRANSELAGMRIVASSASVFVLDKERSRAAGCDGFIAKPLKLDEALKLIGQELGLIWRYRDKSGAQAAEERLQGGQTTQGEAVLLTEEVLRRIYSAAAIGDVLTILRILESAGITNAAVAENTLEGQIWQLAKKFQNRKIKELVAPLIGLGEGTHDTKHDA